MVTVLTVDDSLFMRTLVHKTLSGSGYEVAGEATNGDEAITLVQRM